MKICKPKNAGTVIFSADFLVLEKENSDKLWNGEIDPNKLSFLYRQHQIAWDLISNHVNKAYSTISIKKLSELYSSEGIYQIYCLYLTLLKAGEKVYSEKPDNTNVPVFKMEIKGQRRF